MNKGVSIAAMKFLTILSLYLAATGMLLAFLHSTAPVYLSVGIIFVCSMLSYTLRKIRFVWILPLILSTSALFVEFFLNSHLFVNVLWIFPVYIFGIVFNVKKLYYSDKYQVIKTSNILIALIWIVPVLGITGSGLSKTIGGDNGAAVFGVIFLISGMMLMRYSRHKNVSVDNRSFNLINKEAILLLFATAAVSATVVVGLYDGITRLLLYVTSLFRQRPTEVPVLPTPQETPPYYDEGTNIGLRTAAPVIDNNDKENENPLIGIIFLALIVGAILFFVIVKMKKSNDFDNSTISSDERIKEKSERKRRKGESRHAYNNRTAIRRCYRKFMQLCRDNYIDIKKSMTAHEVCEAAIKVGFSPADCDALVRIYTLARYSDSDITDADAKAAVALYNKIKKKGR